MTLVLSDGSPLKEAIEKKRLRFNRTESTYLNKLYETNSVQFLYRTAPKHAKHTFTKNLTKNQKKVNFNVLKAFATYLNHVDQQQLLLLDNRKIYSLDTTKIRMLSLRARSKKQEAISKTC